MKRVWKLSSKRPSNGHREQPRVGHHNYYIYYWEGQCTGQTPTRARLNENNTLNWHHM